MSHPEIGLQPGDLFMEHSISSRRKRTQRDYNLGFKLAVVEQVEKGELTYKQAQLKYGIQGRSTMLAWLRKHGTQRKDLEQTQRSPRTSESSVSACRRSRIFHL